LQYDAFKDLNDVKEGYYFGLLLADGTSDDGKNIGIYLEKQDKKVVERFRKDLGISNQLEHKIDKRKEKASGGYPEQFGVRVGCKPMMEDLKKLGFFRFKKGEALEDGFFTNLEEKVRYAVLLGFYDGDGEEGSSKIFSTNKKFLEQVKREFDIQSEVNLHNKKGRNYVFLQYCDTKNSYYLSIGSDNFNKMMEIYLFSMERKRRHYPLGPNRYVYENLRLKIKSKENLECLIRIAPIYKLIEIFNVSHPTFKKLLNELDVSPLPKSYWKREENNFWKNDFNQKLAQFLNHLEQE